MNIAVSADNAVYIDRVTLCGSAADAVQFTRTPCRNTGDSGRKSVALRKPTRRHMPADGYSYSKGGAPIALPLTA